jgi:hypothetical protein
MLVGRRGHWRLHVAVHLWLSISRTHPSVRDALSALPSLDYFVGEGLRPPFTDPKLTNFALCIGLSILRRQGY